MNLLKKSLAAPAVCVIALLASGSALAGNVSPKNPYLADSFWPRYHGDPGSQKISPYAGPTAKNHRLRADEIQFKATGAIDSFSAAWSGKYPDGRRALWVGSFSVLSKLDADTFETLSTYVVRPGNILTSEEVERINRKYDKLIAEDKRQEIFDLADKYVGDKLRDDHTGNTYGFLNSKNERLFYFRDYKTGKRYLRYYGDAVAGDIESPIVLKREWELPLFNGKPFSMFAANMTFDGWAILVSNTGLVLAVNDDFSQHQFLDLAPTRTGGENLSAMQSFVRNGLATDDQNGVYVATFDFIARVQWTGKKLSMDPADGAWQAKYPQGPFGCGTTPALVGFGPDEDHLVAVADGEDKMMVMWRDKIPDDWKGIPGYDRRIAGVAPANFAGAKRAITRIENSPTTRDYGIFVANEQPSELLPPQGDAVKTFLVQTIPGGMNGTEAVGAIKWVWDPKNRVLKEAWNKPYKLTGGMCTVSTVNNILYCISRLNGKFNLEGYDWDTGKSKVRYELANSFKFFPWNDLVIDPSGAVLIENWLGMGLTRMKPKN
ncbi:MAG: hypothetical protein PHQ05_09405 [Sterolibacterium sp.]|nr:hypothetical protein [Sterolibacterium sp.]